MMRILDMPEKLMTPSAVIAVLRDQVDRMECSMPNEAPPGFHAFPGLMRTYLRIAERTLEAGGDIMAPPSTDPELAAFPSDLKQLKDQLKTIFGSVAKISLKER